MVFGRSFGKNDEGVAGIVVAVLLIGLAITVLSVLQTIYIPNWMEQREAEHIEEVDKQFSDMKFAVDILCSTQSEAPITTTIPLGSNEIPMPFLSSTKGFGTIKVYPSSCTFTFSNTTDSISHLLGEIRYTSQNAYFININFILESGGIINHQSAGNMMTVNPTLNVIYDTDVNITIYLINITSLPGKMFASGYGNYPVRIQFLNSSTQFFDELQSIAIGTEYLNSWHYFLNNTFNSSNLIYGAGNDYTISQSNDEITIDFRNTLDIDLVIKKFELQVQIGPGWIKT